MNRISLICGFGIGLLVSAVASAQTSNEQPKEIPLDQIWAYEMPGTRDVRELEPKLDVHAPTFKDRYLRSRINYITGFLSTYTPKTGEIADPAFVVDGTGEEALKSAHRVFKERAMREQLVPKDTELSLVFYTFGTGWHPRINSVERSSDVVKVRYQFIAQREPSLGAVRFALIPIGKFSEGTVQVEIEQIPPMDFRGRPVGPKREAERFVCSPFSFDVQ